MQVGRYKGHQYRWTKPFNYVSHHWELRSVHGGIHFSAQVVNGNPCCGLEFHSIYPRGGMAPDHITCEMLTRGRETWRKEAESVAPDACDAEA
jgi:hypothetical protein